MPCWMILRYWHFEESYCLHLQGQVLLDPEVKSTAVLWNIIVCLLVNMANHPCRLNSSPVLLWEAHLTSGHLHIWQLYTIGKSLHYPLGRMLYMPQSQSRHHHKRSKINNTCLTHAKRAILAQRVLCKFLWCTCSVCVQLTRYSWLLSPFE